MPQVLTNMRHGHTGIVHFLAIRQATQHIHFFIGCTPFGSKRRRKWQSNSYKNGCVWRENLGKGEMVPQKPKHTQPHHWSDNRRQKGRHHNIIFILRHPKNHHIHNYKKKKSFIGIEQKKERKKSQNPKAY